MTQNSLDSTEGGRDGAPGVPAPEPYSGPMTAHTNTLAVVSLVTGFFCAIAAVVTGHIALGQIKRTGEAGRGMAVAGLVLGYFSIGVTALALALMLVFALSFGAFFAALGGGSSASAPSAGGSTGDSAGRIGAAYLDEGYLQVGDGVTVVDLYIDPMCPYCGQFDTVNGDTLETLVDDGSITLRVHALTFLDEASQGTDYSSRASSALTCEAAINPAATLDYLGALFANQPGEGTDGLTDDELIALSSGAGSIEDCVRNGDYTAWSQRNTDDALTGPIAGSDLSSIQGTPTVLVDGFQYPGPIDDAEAFADFVTGAAY